MTGKLKRGLILLTGWVLIILGIAGLILPFLQGVLFLLAGLTILSSQYSWAHKLLQKLRERFPALATQLDEARAWVKRIFAPKRKTRQD